MTSNNGYMLPTSWLACALFVISLSTTAAAQNLATTPSDVASLQDRELGEPYTVDGEKVVYGRALPFLAQQVLDLGFDLPNPYGVQAIAYWQEQEVSLDRLSIAVNNGPYQDIDFVDFGRPRVENTTAQLKLDAWVFPFLNVFISAGSFTGDGVIPLAVEGRDLLEFLGFENLCNGGVLEPAFCSRILTAEALPDYKGDALALGMNLAMGWDDYFVTLPLSYAWTDVNILNETVTALNISPRIGYLQSLEQGGSIAWYTGATWLKAEVDLTGSVSFDTSGSDIAGLGNQVALDFVIRQRNRDRWNYMLGFNWELNAAWSVQAEVGFGGSRENVIASAMYRW